MKINKKTSLFLNREPKQRKTINNRRNEKNQDFSILNRETKQKKAVNNKRNEKQRLPYF